MKNKLRYFPKLLALIVVYLLINNKVNAQTWTKYDGVKSLTDATNSTGLAWGFGDASGTLTTALNTDGTGNGSMSWEATPTNRQSIKSKPALTNASDLSTTGTLMFRAKSNNTGTTALDYGFEIEFYTYVTGTTTNRIAFVQTGDGNITLNGASATVPFPLASQQVYHTYRITVATGGIYNVYIDESATPVATLTSASTSSNKMYFRTGNFANTSTDAWTCKAELDWLAFDNTAAYAPGSGTLPTGVIVDGGSVVPVTGIAVTGAANATTITTIGGTLQMSAAITPANATNQNVTWDVTNGTGQATISTSGLLTASKDGTVTVKATAADGSGVSGTLEITISGQTTNIPVTGVTVTGTGGATTITTNGGTLQMVAAITPANATNQNVTWDVTNGTGQATISASGLLTASKDGIVTVKATAADGSTITGTLDITISGQVSSTKKKVGYFTFVKSMTPPATTVQNDPVYLMLKDDPNLDVTLNALADASATVIVDQSLYDVLVIQESLAGNAGILTPAGALGFAKLTKPTLFNKNYALAASRAFKASSTGAGAETLGFNTITSTLVSIKVDPANQSHDLFKGITFVGDSVGLFTSGATDPGLTTGGTAGYKAVNYATNVYLSNTNTLLATPVTVKTADQSILKVSFNDIPSGTVIGGNAAQTVLGETLQTRLLTVGMNFGAICATGGKNINSNGLRIFKNAVYSLAGLDASSIVPVTSITVTGAAGANTITTNGGTLQMSANVAPANATSKNITWSVANGTGEATIDANGLLTAAKNGTVNVIASAKDGSFVVGQLEITISGQSVLVTGITVTGAGGVATITTNAGTLQMSADVTPANATNKDIVWSLTTGSDLASISTTGLLTASKDGTVTVKATAADGSGIIGTLDITITGQITIIPVTVVTVTGTGGATITADGGTLQMIATITPTDATNKNVTWSVVTNGTGQATISTSGLLTASKNGTVTVKATSADVTTIYGELVVTITGQIVRVTQVIVTGTGGASTITTNGGSLQMLASIIPTDAANKNVTWSVANGTGQATISTSGSLTASKNGTVTVRATSTDVSTVYGELPITISGQYGAGINIINGTKLEIYPNPVIDAITMDGASIVKKYEVISLSGKVLVQGVNTGDKLSIKVSNLASGIYLLKVYTAEGSQQVKFMKK